MIHGDGGPVTKIQYPRPLFAFLWYIHKDGITIYSEATEMLTGYKKTAIEAIADKRAAITDLSDAIWEFAETSLMEKQSCEYYVNLLQQEGFAVEENLCGIPTAFSASFGKGRPVIGILAEYDALSGLSRQCNLTQEKELIPGGNGHGCGHNLLGAGSLAAAIGVKAYLQEKINTGTYAEGEGPGTVILYGCPGEEGWASKAYMAREKVWENLDAALSWHPADCNEVAVGRTNACLQHLYTFRGVASHAAGNPEKGRSALDAVELMNIGVQFLREHMGNDQRVHYAITDPGGMSPNVVQAKASVLYYVRSPRLKDATILQQRVDDIAKGAALMTGTTVSKQFVDGLADTVANHVIEKALYENFEALGAPVLSEEELRYAEKLFATVDSQDYIPGLGSENPGRGELVKELQKEAAERQAKILGLPAGTLPAMNDFVIPLYEEDVFRAGSTDVGDVSYLTPTAQINAATWVNASPGHSWQNVTIGKNSIAHNAMIRAGEVLAATAIDLMEKPELLEAAHAEFAKKVKGTYTCPFPPEAKPEIHIG